MRIKLLFYLLIITISAQAQTAVLNCNAGGLYSSNYSINSVLQAEGTCNNFNKKINIAVLDSCSFAAWSTDSCIYYYFNQLNYYDCLSGTNTCISHPLPQSVFMFECIDSAQMNGLITMLNYIPWGHHVLAYTYGFPPTACSLPLSVMNAFIQLGSSMFNTIADTVPFIFYIKKGFLSTIQEVSGTHAYDTVSLTVTLECLPAFVNEKEILESSLNLFPNPSTSEFTIHNSQFTIERIEIYNTLGKKVFSQKLMANSQQQEIKMDISMLGVGIYFVHFAMENGLVTKKFIKQ